jgi:predicted amidohydrolase
VPRDVRANGAIHAQAVHDAGARLVVFPELSLTGYELEAAPVDPEGAALGPLAQACGDAGSIALVGAPIAGPGGREFIAMLAVNASGAVVLYRKRWLGQEESIRFSPGDEPAVLEVDGWRIGVGICKDTGIPEHVERLAELEIDAYCAGLVHLPEELDQQEDRALSIALRCQAFVAFASFAGPTGRGYSKTAGSSGIWSPTGEALARAGTVAGEHASATLGSS